MTVIVSISCYISGVEMDPKYKGTLCDANEVCMHIIASIS